MAKRTMQTRTQKKLFQVKGLTLPELLVAALILAYALCGLVALFVNCSALNEANRNTSIAVSHAQYIMETIRDTTFSDVKTLADAGNWDWGATEITNAGMSPLRNESIDTEATGTRPLQVAVTVSWRDETNRQRTLSTTTLFQ